MLTRQQRKNEERIVSKAVQEIRSLSPYARKYLERQTIEAAKPGIQMDFLGAVHCLYAPVLNTDYGFGKDRINKLIQAVNGQFKGIGDRTIDPKQLVDWCISKDIDFTVEEVEENVKVQAM